MTYLTDVFISKRPSDCKNVRDCNVVTFVFYFLPILLIFYYRSWAWRGLHGTHLASAG
jgi:hypothetical protein